MLGAERGRRIRLEQPGADKQLPEFVGRGCGHGV